jgi:hypothetical protein
MSHTKYLFREVKKILAVIAYHEKTVAPDPRTLSFLISVVLYWFQLSAYDPLILLPFEGASRLQNSKLGRPTRILLQLSSHLYFCPRFLLAFGADELEP